MSPDGTRAYAASALGGLWYSGDSGVTWEPVGAWRTSDRATVTSGSNALTAGAVHVTWGANEGADEVWLGTGEALPAGRRDFGYLGNYGGIGVLHAVGPVATVRANPLADPWGVAQAQPRPAAGGQPAYAGLGGHGFFRVLANPAQPRDLLAATTAGLHRHNPAAAAGTDPWSLVTVPAWEAAQAGASGLGGRHRRRLDPGDRRPRRQDLGDRRRSARRRIDRAVAEHGQRRPPSRPVALPGVPAAPQRFAIGWHPNHADTLYVLTSGPNLWRIDGTLAAPGAGPGVVANIPTTLFGAAGDISFYAIAAAVDPANSARVLVGGAAVTSPIDAATAPSPSFAAALYLLTVAPAGAGTFATDYVMPADGGPNDATWVGSEVHADVHRITWEAPGGVNQVWVGCDGGVFRSLRGGARGTYAASSSGMAVSEPGFVANHPTSPGPLLAGMQDNGTQLRVGEGVWRSAVRNGDSGGVAFDPGAPGRFVAQTLRSAWTEDGAPGRDADVPACLQRRVGVPGRGRPSEVLLLCGGRAHRRRDSRHPAGRRHRPGVAQRTVGPLPLGRRGVAAPLGDAADGHRPASG